MFEERAKALTEHALNPMLVHKTVCGGTVHHLSVLDDDRYHSSFKDVYLRHVEFLALLKWLELLTAVEIVGYSERRLIIGDNMFVIGDRFNKECETVAQRATLLWQKLGFGVEIPFGKYDDKCWIGPKDVALRTTMESPEIVWFLTKAPNPHDRSGHHVMSYELERTPAFTTLSPASVMLADRLMGIIAMGSAPDSGYDLQLRNGIGDINVLQQTDRLGLARIAEDLIR